MCTCVRWCACVYLPERLCVRVLVFVCGGGLVSVCVEVSVNVRDICV